MADSEDADLWRIGARSDLWRFHICGGVLREVAGLGSAVDLNAEHIIGTHDRVVRKVDGSALGPLRMALFAFLYRDAVKVVNRFQLPPDWGGGRSRSPN